MKKNLWRWEEPKENFLVGPNSKTTTSAALAALGNWADDGQYSALIEFIENTTDDIMRRKAFDSAYAFLRIGRERDPEVLGKMWTQLANNARSPGEKLQVISRMAHQ